MQKPKLHKVKCNKCGKEEDILVSKEGIPSNGWKFYMSIKIADSKIDTSSYWLCSKEKGET
jgi:hypothetical protein